MENFFFHPEPTWKDNVYRTYTKTDSGSIVPNVQIVNIKAPIESGT